MCSAILKQWAKRPLLFRLQCRHVRWPTLNFLYDLLLIILFLIRKPGRVAVFGFLYVFLPFVLQCLHHLTFSVLSGKNVFGDPSWQAEKTDRCRNEKSRLHFGGIRCANNARADLVALSEGQVVVRGYEAQIAVEKSVFIYEPSDCGNVAFAVHYGELGLGQFVYKLKSPFILQV